VAGHQGCLPVPASVPLQRRSGRRKSSPMAKRASDPASAAKAPVRETSGPPPRWLAMALPVMRRPRRRRLPLARSAAWTMARMGARALCSPCRGDLEELVASVSLDSVLHRQARFPIPSPAFTGWWTRPFSSVGLGTFARVQ